MGYGKRALQLLKKYYEGHFAELNENIQEKQSSGKLPMQFVFFVVKF